MVHLDKTTLKTGAIFATLSLHFKVDHVSKVNRIPERRRRNQKLAHREAVGKHVIRSRRALEGRHRIMSRAKERELKKWFTDPVDGSRRRDWQIISIDAALKLRAGEEIFRCKECHGRARPHKSSFQVAY